MSEIQYKFAYKGEEGDTIISIDDITKENRKQYKYRCIGCGHELLPRAIDSVKRTSHFYHKHKKDVENCSNETYLHKLTKHIIKKKFDSQSTFFIEYYVSKECNNLECKYRNPRCREEFISHKVDLKKFYDTCTEEAPIKGYIADILLTNSKKPNIEPTLIEVCVSHPCDENKKSSGLRIIEIKIRKEQDVNRLQENGVISESQNLTKRVKEIFYHSFKREFSIPLKIKLQRFILNPKQNLLGCLTEIDCNNAHNRLQRDSLVELNIVNKKNYYAQCQKGEVLYWMSSHKGLRRCNMCKFYYATSYEAYPICRLSKKYGKPVRPSMDEAERCSSFHRDFNINLDDYLIEEVTTPPSE